MASAFKLGKDVWDPYHRFETSWLLPPYALFGLRALFSLYIFTTILFRIGWFCTHSEHPLAPKCQEASQDFSYFTVITYWGLAFYFLVAAVHTFTYAHRGRPLLDRFPRILQVLHSLYYTTIVTFPFVVTIVYWGKLYTGPWFPVVFDAWSNISQHALNSFFALCEVFLTRTAPPPPVHMLWLVVILALYLGVAYLTFATQHFYVYNFLDPAQTKPGIIAAFVFGIAILCLIAFGVVWGIIWLRQFVTERKLGMEGKFARGKPQRWADESRTSDVEMARHHNGK